jgi:hypothetical protein
MFMSDKKHSRLISSLGTFSRMATVATSIRGYYFGALLPAGEIAALLARAHVPFAQALC